MNQNEINSIYPNPENVNQIPVSPQEQKPPKKSIGCLKSCLIVLLVIVTVFFIRMAYLGLTSTTYTYENNGKKVYTIKFPNNKYSKGSLGSEVRVWGKTPFKLSCLMPDAMCGGRVFLSLKVVPRSSQENISPLEEYNSTLPDYDQKKESDISPTTFKGKSAYSIPGGVVLFEDGYMLIVQPTKESEAGLDSWDQNLIDNLTIY